MALLVVLLQVMIGDWSSLPRLVGKGLTAVPVLQLLVIVGTVLLLPGGGLQLVCGQVVLLVGGELRLLLSPSRMLHLRPLWHTVCRPLMALSFRHTH
jgi:hypothetical protein